jgi:imidazolonepropionase-like amidohydrolase
MPGRGVLRPGAAADVLVASGDVAAHITGLQHPVAVFQDGRRVV